MHVLFKNIPIGIKDFELAQYIESKFNAGSIEGVGLSFSAVSIEMLEIQDSYTRPVEQFGIVRITPPEVAKIVIKELNGHSFNKYKITVREFFSRSTSNDPRISNNNVPDGCIEQRKKDRREKTLKSPRRI